MTLACDVALAARIERAEARLLADAIARVARRVGERGDVLSRPLAGGIAAFAEPGSPLNKVAGLGFDGALPETELEKVEKAFARRGWTAAARAKQQYWRSFQQQHGPAEALRIADELRKQVLAQKPGWPNEEERSEDLSAHLRFLDLLERFEARRGPAAR